MVAHRRGVGSATKYAKAHGIATSRSGFVARVCPKCKGPLRIVTAKGRAPFAGCKEWPACEGTVTLPAMKRGLVVHRTSNVVLQQIARGTVGELPA